MHFFSVRHFNMMRAWSRCCTYGEMFQRQLLKGLDLLEHSWEAWREKASSRQHRHSVREDFRRKRSLRTDGIVLEPIGGPASSWPSACSPLL